MRSSEAEIVAQRDALFTALKTIFALFEGGMEQGFVISCATNRQMTNGEQGRIDAAISLAVNALQRVEQRISAPI